MNTKGQTNIFIVDDDKMFSLALKANIESSFENKPIKVHSFVTGETCMQKFNEEQPQIVILDFHLNSKYYDAEDGIQVLDWIKKENAETNVIIVTSDDSCNVALKSFEHGACDYVFKTETQFRKINYSLANLFKIIDVNNEARKHKNETRTYKNMFFGVVLCLAILVGGLLVIQIIEPSLLK